MAVIRSPLARLLAVLCEQRGILLIELAFTIVPDAVRGRAVRGRLREEQGFSLIEVLAGALIIVVGVLGSMAALESSGRATHHAQRGEQAIAVAEREIERLKAVPYGQLGLAALPAHSAGGAHDPNSWVVDGPPPLLELPEAYRDPASADVRPAEPLIGGGTVATGPTPFDTGGTTVTIHRYVTWRDETCAVVTPVDLCAGTQDTKRITVAVVPDTGAGGFRPKPVWASTVVTDPALQPLSTNGAPPESNPGSGPPVTEQPFFLYDTPCSETAPLSVMDSTLNDTTGSTCALLPPDLMGPDAPLLPANGELPQRYDFATDITALVTRPAPPGGVVAGGVVRRAVTDCPTSGTPDTVHQWATTTLPTFATPTAGAHTAFNFVTRTLSGQAGAVTVCVRLHAQKAPSVTLASGIYTLEQWPTTPTPIEFTLNHDAFSFADDRLVFTLSLKASTSTQDIELRYHHPNDRSFISVATTTPQS